MKIYCNDRLIIKDLNTNLTTIISKQDMKYSNKYNCWFYNLKNKGHFKIKTADEFCFMNVKCKDYFIRSKELECVNE